MERFTNVISKSKQDKLLIVDEAHRFTERSKNLLSTYKYMLGLSATPFSGTSALKGKELMSFLADKYLVCPSKKRWSGDI